MTVSPFGLLTLWAARARVPKRYLVDKEDSILGWEEQDDTQNALPAQHRCASVILARTGALLRRGTRPILYVRLGILKIALLLSVSYGNQNRHYA